MNEQTKIKLLAEVHEMLHRDLESDIESGLVEEQTAKDWQEGWHKRCFASHMLSDTPVVVKLTNQLETYQRAMEFHAKRAAELNALITDKDKRISMKPFEDKNICDACKFGEEPDLQKILDFLLLEGNRVFESKKEGA